MHLWEMGRDKAQKLLQKPWCEKRTYDEAYNAASPGVRETLDKVDSYLYDFMKSPQNAVFGRSINPDVLYGVILDAAQKYNLDTQYLHLVTYRLGSQLGW